MASNRLFKKKLIANLAQEISKENDLYLNLRFKIHTSLFNYLRNRPVGEFVEGAPILIPCFRKEETEALRKSLNYIIEDINAYINGIKDAQPTVLSEEIENELLPLHRIFFRCAPELLAFKVILNIARYSGVLFNALSVKDALFSSHDSDILHDVILPSSY